MPTNLKNLEERSSTATPLAGCVFLLVVFLLAIGGSVALWWLWPEASFLNPQEHLSPNAKPRTVVARGKLSDFEEANIEIYKNSAPSVVQVATATNLRNLFNLNVQSVPKGVGSGFMWDKNGHIVTNYHVVDHADTAKVTLSDGSTYEAQQIWAHPDQDIAVVLINAPKSKLVPIPIGSSHDLRVGQVTYALGDPFGLDKTMTMGIVSALDRTIESSNNRTIEGVIQTSAAINPGNSGGPLLDSAGRLIGMNTAIASPSGAFAGIGFAVPVDEINSVVPELIRHGKVVRPRLGVMLAATDVARKLGVEHGALIITVVPDSAATKAGLHGTSRNDDGQLKLGDVITGIDGKAIDNSNQLVAAIEKHEVGDAVTLSIHREGKDQDVRVTLQESK
ncbi:MAG TPA: trypsin-like peptidase domain-containing protein [Gemmataceae bacterium]|nr:trypsin-like peptidase domain-containing protein [Gemmataceae bacterium]